MADSHNVLDACSMFAGHCQLWGVTFAWARPAGLLDGGIHQMTKCWRTRDILNMV